MSPDTSPELLKIVISPDKRLKKTCRPVKKDEFGTSELNEQVGRMTQTMYAYAGIGLAANQVGYENRVIVVAKDPSLFPKTTPLVLINPVLRRSTKKQTLREGCLSFPGETIMRRRAKSIMVTAYNVMGEQFRWQAKGLAAQCIQHEVDHINGKTMFDK